MNKNQIRTKKKQIALMDADTLEDFARAVHTSDWYKKQEVKDELLKAIDVRQKELANSFSLEVETSELRMGEL